jgi:hypothetical protein
MHCQKLLQTSDAGSGTTGGHTTPPTRALCVRGQSQQTNRTRHQGLADMRDVPNAASQFILYGPHTDFAYVRE